MKKKPEKTSPAGNGRAEAEKLLQQALACHQKGELDVALHHYRQVLVQAPGHTAALANMASLYTRKQEFETALGYYQEVLHLDGNSAETWFNYGNLQQRLGMKTEAEQSFANALRINPALFPAHYNLANLLRDRDADEAALLHYREARRLAPGTEKAQPNFGKLLMKRAQALLQQGAAEDALLLYREADVLQPGRAEVSNALGVALQAAGKLQEAEAAWHRCLALEPAHVEALANLGTLCRLDKRHQLALEFLRRAVALRPDDAASVASLASTLIELGAISEALQQIERAGQPGHADLLCMQAYALVQQARIDEAQVLLAQARAQKPDKTVTLSNMSLFSSLYSDSLDTTALTRLHKELSAVVSHDITPCPQRRIQAGKDQPLRIGYLSPDFRSHPVGFFIDPVLQHHDASRVAVTCYALPCAQDAHTERLRHHGHTWRDFTGWNRERMAAQIQADGIDILVDLAGPTAGGRADLMACRAAPVQAVFIGYPYTTGLAAIDYIIADHHLIPPALESCYSESPARLADSFLCYQPQPGTPEVATLPALRQGHVTFGSYNNLPKLSASCVALWARVLHAVPNARLVLMASSLADAGTRALVLQRFAQQGIAAGRIDLLPPVTPLNRFLSEYRRIDIALDPLPFNGGTTTCDALWMGVPVITLTGTGFMSRMGTSLLTTALHPEWIATDADAYVRIATALAADVPRLAQIRANLRGQLLASKLCDGAAYTRSLEDLYRQMAHS